MAATFNFSCASAAPGSSAKASAAQANADRARRIGTMRSVGAWRRARIEDGDFMSTPWVVS
jgi:hypothetical protein